MPQLQDARSEATSAELQICAALARWVGGRGCSEPPTVAFEIASPVLALTVWLIARFAINLCAGSSRSSEVRVNVIYVNDQSTGRRPAAAGRSQAMLLGHAVQPDNAICRPNLTVDHVAVSVALDTTGLEAKRLHQKVVGSLDVLVDQEGDHAGDGCHLNGAYVRRRPGAAVTAAGASPREPLARRISTQHPTYDRQLRGADSDYDRSDVNSSG